MYAKECKMRAHGALCPDLNWLSREEQTPVNVCRCCLCGEGCAVLRRQDLLKRVFDAAVVSLQVTGRGRGREGGTVFTKGHCYPT